MYLKLLLIIVGPLLILAVIGLVIHASRRLIRARWTRIADQLGMRFAWNDLSPRIIDERDGYRVTICPAAAEDRGTMHEVQLDLLGKIPDELRLMARWILRSRVRIGEGPGIETGDRLFDDEVFTDGPGITVLPLLDAKTRRLILNEVAGRATAGTEVARGKVHLGLRRLRTARVEPIIERGLRFAEHLYLNPGQVAERLALNAVSDPQVGIQLNNLRLLQEHFADQEITVATSRQLLDAEAPELRLEAGQFLGEEALATLAAIAGGHDVQEELRVRAIERLAKLPDNPQVQPLLERLLGAGAARVRTASVIGLGRLGHSSVLPRLLEVASDPSAEVVEALAWTLADIGDPAAEPCLISLLSDADTLARVAAAYALGEIGTTTALDALHRAKQSLSPELRNAAEAAITAIHNR